MRICFWGTYTVAAGYPINRILIRGLRQAGARVEECREELWHGFLHAAFSERRLATYLGLGWRALRVYLRLVRRYRQFGEHQCVIVGYAGYFDILLARLLNWRQRRLLVLVAFISLYDTIVVDRQQVPARSWRARLLKKIDRLAFSSADVVLVDTQEHIVHYAGLFRLPPEKFHRSFVGGDDELFCPGEAKGNRGIGWRVLFFGTYVPLHGIETILDAAQELRSDPEVEFVLIGNGQLYPRIRREAACRGLDNICFIDTWAKTAELVEHIRRADVCLGIFGTTAKASRVIPYKVFDTLAVQKPLITRDSPAIREMLQDGESVVLCPAGDGGELARAIAHLKNHPERAAQLAVRGYVRFRERGSPGAIGRILLQKLEACVGEKCGARTAGALG